MPADGTDVWRLEQLARSEFFHQKLHSWGLLDIARYVEHVRGEMLEWRLDRLGISEGAWNKAIHSGIRPVTLFAHPTILMERPRAIGYYRMLAMVSQKSMARIGLPVSGYERGMPITDPERAVMIARRLNEVISHLVEADDELDHREFDIWRGMAAGSQAQGSWQNFKGDKVELLVKEMFRRRLRERGMVVEESEGGREVGLIDGRMFVFGDEPDIGIYRAGRLLAAVEIKGGIDAAGVLERIGAALKSLSRAKEASRQSVTVLLLQGVSLTERAVDDLKANRRVVNRWFKVEDVIGDEVVREELFSLLNM